MATRSLGTLTLDLIARIGGYERGLDKAEKEAKKRARAIQKVFEDTGRAIGIGIGGAIAGAIGTAAVFDKLIKQAGDFQDIAEKIGGSGEGVASFAVAAGTTGTAMETVAAASVKLTKALVEVDDESKAAGAALAALGLNLADFKRLAPEEQLDEVAKALAGFEDGAAKTAVAVALFGKAGAELLPFLKELEAQGGRQVILTEEQIRLADEYADKQARARAELNLYAQAAATQALPALNALTAAVSDVIKEFLGVDSATKRLKESTAVASFAEGTVKFLGFVVDAADGVARIFEFLGLRLGKFAAQAVALAKLDFAAVGAIEAAHTDDLAKLWGRQTLGSRLDAQLSSSQQMAALSRQEDRGFRPPGNRLNFTGARDKEKKAAAERQTEAERYLESLQKQLEKTRDLNVEETLLAEIQSGRLKISGKVTQDQLVALAKQVDAARAAATAEKERIEDGRAAAIAAGDAVIKKAEEFQSTLSKLLAGGPNAQLEAQRKEMQLLADAFLMGTINAEQFNDAASGALGLVAEKLTETKSIAEELGLSFASAFEDAIVGGKEFSEVLKALEQDILRIVTRKLVTEPFAQWVSGQMSNLTGGGGGGGFLDGLFGGIGKLFSGFFADGGMIPAGHFGVVGEAGPEFVSGPARITPMSGSGINVAQHFHFAAPTSSLTRAQVAKEAQRGLRDAQRIS
jgi:hypothetical protein